MSTAVGDAVTRSNESAVDALCPLSSNSVLARYGDLTVLCEAVPGQQHRVGELLDAVAGLAANEADGRQLSHQLASLVGVAGLDDEFPALCAFAPAREGMVAVVHGGAELIITANGEQVHLDGRQAVTVVDRVITDPVESIQAFIGDTQVDTGTMPALLPAQPQQDPEAPAAPETPAEPADELTAIERTVSRVLGVHCKRDHFNDPDVTYCAVCGISMAQGNRVQGWGSRPELGLLLLEDGGTHSLARDTVIGRMPHIDDAVADGEADPLTITHPMVSRRHVRITLSDWQVMATDADSANGTFLLTRDGATWTRLEPGVATVVPPGSTISLGVVQLRYHSYRSN